MGDDGESNPFDSEAEIAKREGYALPHWTRVGAIYHAVFRQADALPASKLEEFRAEQERLLSKSELSPGDREKLKYFASDRAQAYLDAGHGSCLMKRPEVANLISRALAYFDGQRYLLHAYAVMPNHVHTVIEPKAGHSLEQILHSWKSFTAHEVNKLLVREGQLWLKESFDHLIRSPAEYRRAISYVVQNPSKAHLTSWPWVYSAGIVFEE